jgi:hypothetical protein
MYFNNTPVPVIIKCSSGAESKTSSSGSDKKLGVLADPDTKN